MTLTTKTYGQKLVEIGIQHGLHRLGITNTNVLTRARNALVERKSLGLSNEMQFTYRNPIRSTDPRKTMPAAQSIIVGAMSYDSLLPTKSEQTSARVGRYAWTDYYQILEIGLRQIASQLKADGWRAIVLADDNSIVDREVAYQAGLGWFGKNANLLIEGSGSYFVLGSVITDAQLLPITNVVEDGCGSCHRCVDNCPTQAIVAPGVVDARKCLAWLLQKPGVFDRKYRSALGDRLYGCDDCQEVCPPTIRGQNKITEKLNLRAWVPLLEMLNANDQSLLDEFGAWYIADRDPKWIRRNGLIILGNIGNRDDREVVTTLTRYLSDDDPYLRAHAVWAARKLGLSHLVALSDPDPIVQEELDAELVEI